MRCWTIDYVPLLTCEQGQRAHSLTIPVPPSSESLGLTLQLAPLNSTYNIWHILTIPSPLSPAHIAGLLPHSDYILGSPSGTLRGESAFGELVEDHLNRSLVLWVYNSEFNVVREVEMIPRRGWGGEGALGAVLGYGALHRLPVGLTDEVQAPGEKLFDAERKSMDRLYNGGDESFQQAPPPMAPPVAPPPMVNPNVPPPPMMNPNTAPQPAAPARARKGKHHGALSPGSGFDDIFAEGQKKSAEQDHIPSRKGTPLAPPPKLGSAPITPHDGGDETQDPLNAAGEDIGEPGDAEEA